MRTHKDDRTPGCIHKKFDRLVHERDWDEDFFISSHVFLF